ncbi:hypothetical protein HQ535_02935 [bacterium]|nr:hypothetical protein [bacterium]
MLRTLGTTLLALSLVVVAAPAATAAVSPVIRPGFDWSMPDRFGFDADHDGRLDIPNSPAYVAGRSEGSCFGRCASAPFLVVLDASTTAATMGGSTLDLLGFRWQISGNGITAPLKYSSVSPRLTVALAEGAYEVTLTVIAALPGQGTVTARVSGPVVVDDLLVVAIGDSYTSGEGNPEVRRDGDIAALWADGATAVAEADHSAAHRSSAAWPVQAALALERLDPHTSVTFITVATSGAEIQRGVLSPQPSRHTLSQIDQVEALVGDRDIDMLLMSIGGNDVGFGKMVHGLVDADRLLDPFCYGTDVANVWQSVYDGNWNRSSAIDIDLFGARIGCKPTAEGNSRALPGLSGLGTAYDRLAAEISGRLHPESVIITEYPDPTGGGNETCGEIVGDITAPLRFHEISTAEQNLGREYVLNPLNDAISQASRRHGWIAVPHVSDAFAAGHGYCGDWPDYGYPDSFFSRPSWMRSRGDYPDGWYRSPGLEGVPAEIDGPGVTWYRTAAQSAAIQGPSDRTATPGTLHPNELGHQAIAGRVLGVVVAWGLG